MPIMRRLIYPVSIAGAANLLIIPLIFRGPGAFLEFDFGFIDFVTMVFFVLIGLLFVGYPTAQFLTGTDLSMPKRIGALIIAGASGGGLIAFLVSWLHPTAALFGIISGVVSALIWALFNFDFLGHRAKGETHV